MLKTLNTKTIELNKDSHQTLKDFKKNNMSTEDFIEQYKTKRREYHKYNACKDTLMTAQIEFKA